MAPWLTPWKRFWCWIWEMACSWNISSTKSCYMVIYDRVTLLGTNISPKNGILKMIFPFPRWDMLVPWRVELKIDPYSCFMWHLSDVSRGLEALGLRRGTRQRGPTSGARWSDRGDLHPGNGWELQTAENVGGKQNCKQEAHVYIVCLYLILTFICTCETKYFVE